MRASLILCDSSAQDMGGGKVHMLGAGWSMIGPEPAPHAVVAFIKVGWTEANEPHKLVLRLTDGDGNVVSLPGPTSAVPMEFSGSLEVGRPPGVPQGSDIDATFALNLGPLPLAPGHRYRWILEINSEELASEGFYVRRPLPPPPQPGASAQP